MINDNTPTWLLILLIPLEWMFYILAAKALWIAIVVALSLAFGCGGYSSTTGRTSTGNVAHSLNCAVAMNNGVIPASCGGQSNQYNVNLNVR